MKTTYNKFLIISTCFFLLGGVYLYFSSEMKINGIIPTALGSSLSSSTDEDFSVNSVNRSGVSENISFLADLVSLKSIKIDTDFFNEKFFRMLKDNSVIVPPVLPGRPNPFQPIGVSVSNNAAINQGVVTGQPSQITDVTAVLSGTVKVVNESASTYFEYSQKQEETNPIVVSAKQSLVGTFVKNIKDLTPKTTYYFRACAKINNVTLCGEKFSFTTN